MTDSKEGAVSGAGTERECEGPKVYVVIPVGIYDHGVVGVLHTIDDARALCERLWTKTDGYHAFRIEEWPIGCIDSTRGPEWSWGSDYPVDGLARIEFVEWDESSARTSVDPPATDCPPINKEVSDES